MWSCRAKSACAWCARHTTGSRPHAHSQRSSSSTTGALACCLLPMQDEVIHRKVFRIVGSIPAVNFLKVPKDKALGLSGRFLYLQVSAVWQWRGMGAVGYIICAACKQAQRHS